MGVPGSNMTTTLPPTNRTKTRADGLRLFALLAVLAVAGAAAAQLPPPVPPVDPVFDPKTVTAPIVDFTPLGGADTPDSKALASLILHARHFATATLAEKAEAFPAVDRLKPRTGTPTAIAEPELRFKLLKFTGRLVRVSRFPVAPEVKDGGITALYESKFLLADRPDPVYIVSSSLPEGVTVGEQPPTAPKYQVAGYLLKMVRSREADLLPDQTAERSAPLLVAPSFGLPPVPRSKYDFEGDKQAYQGIIDFVSMKDGDRFAEGTAHDDLVLHARQFSHEELLAAAEAVPVTDLLRRKKAFVPPKVPGTPSVERLKMEREDLRFKLTKVTGQLKRIVNLPVGKELAAAGVTQLFEVWLLLPRSDEAVCAIVTDLPKDLAPTPELENSRTVTLAGYFLKVIRYESGEKGKDGQPQGRYAPVFISRSLSEAEKPDLDTGHNWRTVFLPAILIGLGLLTATLIGLRWWFRASDRGFRKVIAARQTNPFADGTTDAPPPTGD